MPFVAVPDWFSGQNQGADTAVADLTGSGRPDLLVLMVDDGPEQNRHRPRRGSLVRRRHAGHVDQRCVGPGGAARNQLRAPRHAAPRRRPPLRLLLLRPRPLRDGRILPAAATWPTTTAT